MPTELIYCVREGLREAVEFGRATWGPEVQIPDEPEGFHAAEYVAKARAGELEVVVLSGVITELDPMPDGDVWVTAVGRDGVAVEIVAVGEIARYRPGRELTVRQLDISSMCNGVESWCVTEIWLGDGGQA